jgi:aspartate aminotransferase-like enzyme
MQPQSGLKTYRQTRAAAGQPTSGHIMALGWFSGQVLARSWPVLARSRIRSRAVRFPIAEAQGGVDPEALRTMARVRFQVPLSGGLGSLAGRVFRIGHMGDINAAMVLGELCGVEAALRVQGVPIGSGGAQRAIEYLTQRPAVAS